MSELSESNKRRRVISAEDSVEVVDENASDGKSDEMSLVIKMSLSEASSRNLV
jgi:hypothetical protein